MCGIFALLPTKTPLQDDEIESLKETTKVLEKRGPDRTSFVTTENGFFAFYRLAINDLSENGDQPMRTVTNVLLMCNGEIYNHKQLREEFELKCTSDSDCEVILRMYELYGFENTIKRLYGVFAIILVDGDKVYMARDRLGVRPLYFGLRERSGQMDFILSSVHNPLVKLCKTVSQFPIGTVAKREKGDAVFKILDVASLPIPNVRLTQDIALTDLRNTLINAVKARLISDRPIGCLLSGGLDSSLVTSILVRLIGAHNVRTYSIGMEGSTDLKYARIVANHFKTKHTEVLFTPEEGFAVIPEVIECLGSYDITTIRASVGMFLISRYISKNSSDRVIFSGEGSDEIMEGYLYFHKAPTPEEGEKESHRLIKNLHLYDVLRADRCISSNGLELREPFLDQRFLDCALSLKPEDKAPREGYEKWILRKAFEGFLPNEVLWRRKEGFSDGVSSVKKSWYQHIQEKVDKLIPDEIFNSVKYVSKEAMYYKLVFEKLFPTYNLKLDYWMPKWTNATDPSGRVLENYDEKPEEEGK